MAATQTQRPKVTRRDDQKLQLSNSKQVLAGGHVLGRYLS